MSYPQKEEEYVSFLEGKRIALVGPAASLTGQGLGEKIDSYDVVVRIKSFDAGDIEDAGERCDVLYQTSPYDRCDVIEKKEKLIFGNIPSYVFERYEDPVSVYKEKGIQWVCSCYPQEEWFAENFIKDWESLGDKIRWRYSHYTLYKAMKNVASRPNSGFATFLDLCSIDFSELFVCGLDFYRSMYKDNYQNSLATEDLVHRWSFLETAHASDNRMEVHKPDAQYANFKKLVQVLNADKEKITFDPWFSEVMKDPAYDSMYDRNETLQRQIISRWEKDPEMGIVSGKKIDITGKSVWSVDPSRLLHEEKEK
jgi:hypothetical protein